MLTNEKAEGKSEDAILISSWRKILRQKVYQKVNYLHRHEEKYFIWSIEDLAPMIGYIWEIYSICSTKVGSLSTGLLFTN